MAFRIADRGRRDCCCPSTEEGTPNVVATQSWVRNALRGIMAWATSFRTGSLQVEGQTQSQTIITNAVRTSEIQTESLVLVDRDGKAMKLYVGDDGKVAVEYAFENVYLYPSTGIDVRCLYYTNERTIVDEFNGLTPEQVFMKFVEYTDVKTTTYDEVECPRLCLADGEDKLVDRTLMFTCGQNKLMTGLQICDQDMNLLATIPVPEGKAVRRLTVNLPYFVDENEVNTFVELPKVSSCPCGGDTIVLPHFPGRRPNPSLKLSADIFDDEVRLTNGGLDVGTPAVTIEDCACGKPEQPHLATQTTDEVLETDEIGVRQGAYVTDAYSNLVLKRSDFKANKMQFLLVQTRDA